MLLSLQPDDISAHIGVQRYPCTCQDVQPWCRVPGDTSGKHKIVEIKNFDFLSFAFLFLSGKLGKQSSRFRAAKTFFFAITLK
jgi:hypothetical protein